MVFVHEVTMLKPSRRLRALILPLSCALLSAVTLSATSEAAPPAPAPNGDVRITVDARQVPLGKLLKQFAVLAHVEDVTLDPSLENVLVSIKLDGVTPAEAFRAALADAGADFAIAGSGPDLHVVAHALARNAAAARSGATPPGRPVKDTLEKAEADAMLAVMKGQDAVAQADNSAPEAQDAPEAPESHADPVAAFLGRGGAPAEAAPAPSVSSPAQAAPLTMPTSILGNGSAGKPAAPSAAPADLPTDPFARYLTVMSATTPPKQ
jgi:hypothetical protein